MWASELRPLERLVALAYAKHAGSNTVVWVSMADLLRDTGLTRNSARKALRELVDAGWLVLVQKERQQHAARYRLSIPSTARKAQGGSTSPSEEVISAPSEGGSSSPSESAGGQGLTRSGGQELTPGGQELTPKLGLYEPPPPPTAVDALWEVVVHHLPDRLALSLTRTRTIEDALQRLSDDGWAPTALGERTAGRGWQHAEAGAVVTWLSNLPAAKTAVQPLGPGATTCSIRDHARVQLTAAGVCPSCRADQLAASA